MNGLNGMRTLADWVRSEGLNYSTLSKRRREAGLGIQVPPKTWLLTKKEWEEVKRTPLPGCRRVQ